MSGTGARRGLVVETLRVVGFAGSLRKGSFNQALLRAAAEEAPEGLAVQVLEVGDVPVFNVDLESDPPEAVTRLQRSVLEADGVLIVTPEYNAGLPGVTKNLVDWASRPSGAAVLAGKPVAIMGATRGSWGTVRAQAQLRQTLSAIGALDMKKPEVMVPRAAEKFDGEGRLVDEATRKRLREALASFARWIRLVRSTDP